MDEQQLQDLEKFFHERIPITEAMGIRVLACDEQQLTLTAPLDRNHNHLGTAFGGSLSAVATLAGYGLLWTKLADRSCHVVIRDSTLSFRRPVRGEIRAICRSPEDGSFCCLSRVNSRERQSPLVPAGDDRGGRRDCRRFPRHVLAMK
jgi:thioesterase domain-containing protein